MCLKLAQAILWPRKCPGLSLTLGLGTLSGIWLLQHKPIVILSQVEMIWFEFEAIRIVSYTPKPRTIDPLTWRIEHFNPSLNVS